MSVSPNPCSVRASLTRRILGILALWACSTTAVTAAAAEADPRLAGYRTPPGWKVAIAATEPLVINPVTMTFGPDGRLYVAEWREGREPNDHIKVLTDIDGDGTFDKADMYMDGLDLPAGILFWDGWTYVTLNHDVVRHKDKDGDGRFEVREVIATGFGNDNSHHRVSGMILGPDGWLYLTTGDSDAHAKGSDGSTGTVLRSGGVFRCKPDGTHMQVVGFGMRNPWGNVAFDDEFHIVHTDNDNEGSPGFTGCRVLHVVEGGDYGWRLREGARCCNPDFERATWNGGRPSRLGWITETGRGAPAGLGVLNSSAFPPSTRNLLVYPDVFRKLVRAYTLKPAGATYAVAKEVELLASDEGLFRPTDAEIGPDGALYILDWRTDSGGAGALSGNGKTGRLYRMTWGGTDEEPARPTLPRDRYVRLLQGDEPALIEALKSDDYGMRRVANLELIRRGVKDTKALSALWDDPKVSPATKRHALAIASALGFDKARAVLQKALKDQDSSVKRLAYEYAARAAALSDDPSKLAWTADVGLPEAYPEVSDLARFAKDDPQLLRAVCGYLGTTGKVLVAAYLIEAGKATSGADAFLRDGVTRGLQAMGKTGLDTVVSYLSTPDPANRAAALEILQGWRGEEALANLLETATGSSEIPTEARVGLFRALREIVGAVPPDRIVAWLVQNPKADPAIRVEAIRVLAAMHQRAILSAGPILTGLLTDDSADVRRAALGLALDVRSKEAKDALIALAKAANAPADERRLAVSALRAYEDKALTPMFAELFGTSDDAGFRTELLRTLASVDFEAASGRAKALLNEKDRSLRQEAIGLLGQKPQSALMVAELYNAGKLPPEDLPRVIEAIRPHATPEIQAALQALLKSRLLAAPTGEEARRLRQYVQRFGNAERGKSLYLDGKKAGCTTCHRLEGVGGSVGPDLTKIYETLSFDKRVESILEPSKEIKEGFGTFKVATTDGRVISGLLLSDTAEGVTLKDAEGREVRVPAKEIEDKGTDKTSLMPVGVVGHLSFNELADLLAFLGDRATQESLRGQSLPK